MILYQDAALVVVNKPAGLSSEAGLPARLRDKTSVFSHIRVINGREYLVFRR